MILTSLHPANSRIVGLRPTLCRPLVSRRQPIPLVTGRDLHIPFLLNPRFFLALADPFSGSREISVIVMMRVGLVHFRARGCLRPLLLVLPSCFSLTLTLSFHSFTPAHATRASIVDLPYTLSLYPPAPVLWRPAPDRAALTRARKSLLVIASSCTAPRSLLQCRCISRRSVPAKSFHWPCMSSLPQPGLPQACFAAPRQLSRVPDS